MPSSTGDGLQTTRLSTAAPVPFDFVGTAYSHGWVALAPNRWDDSSAVLRRAEKLASGRVVELAVSAIGGGARPRMRIDVSHLGALERTEATEVRRVVRRMFRLDEDMGPFVARCQRAGGPWRAVSRGLGRLLRSPTVFEDTVKTICTTNVQWGGTRSMVRRLVRALGDPGPPATDGSHRAFPTPRAIAAAGDAVLKEAGLGYRARYVHELAERVASGELDLESLNDRRVSTEEVEGCLRGINGVGSYASATLLMLLGRYERLALDSVFRGFVTERYFAGRRPTDSEAAAVYAEWGEWKYLAYWFDLWRGTEENL